MGHRGGGIPLGQEEKIKNLSFEEALQRLEEVVEQLENGDIPLEQSIELYQEGVLLARHCDQKLKQVQQKIEILIEKDGKNVLQPFEAGEDNIDG